MTKKHNLHIGRIHADWCMHCTSLKKEWDKMKKDLQFAFGRSIKKTDLSYYDFEDSEQRKQQGHFIEKEIDDYNAMFLANSDVKLAIHGGFPTIFKLLDGKIEYYEGNRDAKSMISWFTQGIKQKGGKKSRKIRQKPRRSKRSTRKSYFFGWF